MCVDIEQLPRFEVLQRSTTTALRLRTIDCDGISLSRSVDNFLKIILDVGEVGNLAEPCQQPTFFHIIFVSRCLHFIDGSSSAT